MDVTIYHNPRCSKSRETLQLLRDRGVEPKVVEYLKDRPDKTTIEKLVAMLGGEPLAMMRQKEEPFKKLKDHDHQTLVAAMVEHPVLIERPIVVKGDKARIGRPPRKVLEIL